VAYLHVSTATVIGKRAAESHRNECALNMDSGLRYSGDASLVSVSIYGDQENKKNMTFSWERRYKWRGQR
jgi:hypothetical protein